jgi:hypothetical protein
LVELHAPARIHPATINQVADFHHGLVAPSESRTGLLGGFPAGWASSQYAPCLVEDQSLTLPSLSKFTVKY